MAHFSVLLALNLVSLALIFLYVRGRVRRTLELDGLVDKLRAEVGELVRELNQTTDRNITLVEDTIRTLREASSEADRRAAVLKRETERRTTENAVYDRLGRMRNTSAVPSGEAHPRAPGTAETARPPAGEAAPPGFEVPASPPSENPAAAPEGSAQPLPFVSFSSTPIRPKPSVKEEVLGLSRRGISSDLVAAKLGITVAEVELIVSLEEQKGRKTRQEGT